MKGLWRGEEEEEVGAAAAADAGAQRGQAEPSELQWRSGSPTFLWNTVFTLRSREEGGGGARGGRHTGKEIISRTLAHSSLAHRECV